MNWSMPRPVLQVVATVIALASLGSFVLGAFTAPARGRLPGERPPGPPGAILEAVEAKPLGEERIEGAAQPKELTEAEKAQLEADRKAKAEAEALAKLEAEKGAPVSATLPTGPITPPPALQEITPPEKVQPIPEEPVF